MLSSHHFLCLLHLPPWTVPCRTVLASPDDCMSCPYHFSLRLFTEVRRSSYSPKACPILAFTSSLVMWSLYEIPRSLPKHLSLHVVCLGQWRMVEPIPLHAKWNTSTLAFVRHWPWTALCLLTVVTGLGIVFGESKEREQRCDSQKPSKQAGNGQEAEEKRKKVREGMERPLNEVFTSYSHPHPTPSLSVPLTLPDDVCVSVSTILLTLNDFRYAASDYYSLWPKTNMNWDQGLIWTDVNQPVPLLLSLSLSVCLSVCLSLCLSVSLCLSLPPYISWMIPLTLSYMNVCICLCLCICIESFVCMCVHACLHTSVYVCICASVPQAYLLCFLSLQIRFLCAGMPIWRWHPTRKGCWGQWTFV